MLQLMAWQESQRRTFTHTINATETLLDNSVFSAELGLHNYGLFRKDSNKNGGGFLTAIKNDLLVTRKSELKFVAISNYHLSK